MISIVFYCFAINDWKNRLSRQINRLVSSGLYQSADSLFLFVTDVSGELKSEIENLLKDFNKIELNYTEKNYGEGFLALSKIGELAREKEELKILYFHTKGVFNKYKDFETKEKDELKIRGVNCWVEMMEYFLIDNWRVCIKKLKENDTVGVICNNNWWWGNFWWANASHIKRIPKIEEFYLNRWSAEAWLHESYKHKEKIKYFELRPAKYALHHTVIPSYFYDGTQDTNKLKIYVKSAKYGYFAEQRDEGRPFHIKKDSLIDVTQKVKIILEENPKAVIEPHYFGLGKDLIEGEEKNIRIIFNTNIDPENEYTITSVMGWNFTII